MLSLLRLPVALAGAAAQQVSKVVALTFKRFLTVGGRRLGGVSRSGGLGARLQKIALVSQYCKVEIGPLGVANISKQCCRQCCWPTLVGLLVSCRWLLAVWHLVAIAGGNMPGGFQQASWFPATSCS
jgi:hypothetical protein